MSSKTNYIIAGTVFGFVFVFILSIFVGISNLKDIEIKRTNQSLNFHAPKVNEELNVEYDAIDSIEYIKCDNKLSTRNEITGPVSKNGAWNTSEKFKTNAFGAETNEYAIGIGNSVKIGECQLFIFWNQYSYISIKTNDGKYILFNQNTKIPSKDSDELTYELYQELVKKIE